MWVRLKNQEITEGNLLVQEFSREDDLYNKDLPQTWTVKSIENNIYILERWFIEPNFPSDFMTEMPMNIEPLDIDKSYEELVNEKWHLWIE